MRSNFPPTDLAQPHRRHCLPRCPMRGAYSRSTLIPDAWPRTEPRLGPPVLSQPHNFTDACNRTSEAWLADPHGRIVPIRDQLHLGRSVGNDCQLPDQGVSRRHASIRRDGDGVCWLLDLESVNGTFLNVARVNGPSRLQHGDRIRIGPFDMVFNQPDTSSVLGESYRRETRWLLLADIVQATLLLQRSGTQSYQARLGQWLRNAQWIVNRYCGSIHEFVGDGFFACWPDDDGIEREVMGALRTLRVTEVASAFEFRLVLHRGEVRVAEQGSLHRAGLCGEAVHYLFRLEKVAGRMNCHNLFSEESGSRLRPALPALTPVQCEVPDFGQRRVYTLPSEAWGQHIGRQPSVTL